VKRSLATAGLLSGLDSVNASAALNEEVALDPVFLTWASLLAKTDQRHVRIRPRLPLVC
jgi:hypothetical protein